MNRYECYQILGLPFGAGEEDIETAYRRLAKEWHPDRNKSPEAEDKMKKINQAHDILIKDWRDDSPMRGWDIMNDIINRRAWSSNIFSSFPKFGKTTLTIELEDPSDAEKILRILQSSFKIKSYKIEKRA